MIKKIVNKNKSRRDLFLEKNKPLDIYARYLKDIDISPKKNFIIPINSDKPFLKKTDLIQLDD
ncbi:hypothetical protein [Bacteroides sp.]|uniref:hypothetical protein n=1 Tax=Bacteroides sp. TaxID=29523 RepID=UPI00258438B1|nr:hypothetical protein [Bacteroides sp.]